MRERGVIDPPKIPLLKSLADHLGINASVWLQDWRAWERWFSLVTKASSNIQVLSATFNPTQVNTITTSEQTVTVTGVLLDRDVVLSVTKPTHTAGIGIVNARVSADDTIAVTFVNPTAGNIDPPSETYVFVVLRK
jgi:hypothetical protein